MNFLWQFDFILRFKIPFMKKIFQCSKGDSIQITNVKKFVILLHATGTWEFGQNLHNFDCNKSTVNCHAHCFFIILFAVYIGRSDGH